MIVVHPGSRFLRIGRASDVFPMAIPNVIARKSKVPVPPRMHRSYIISKSPTNEKAVIDLTDNGETMDVEEEPSGSWDPVRSCFLYNNSRFE